MFVSVATEQGLQSNKIIHNLVLAQGTFVPNTNFMGPQIAELCKCVSVAIVTMLAKQQNNTQCRIGTRKLCNKYELHRPSNRRVICCHGNKVYKPTN